MEEGLEAWSKLPTVWENGGKIELWTRVTASARGLKFESSVPGHYNNCIIGSGSFGKVIKVTGENGELYALKVIPNSNADVGKSVSKVRENALI